MPTVDELLDLAKALPDEQRLDLVVRLVGTLNGESADEAAWALEIKQRIDDLDSGRVKGIPVEEARRRREEDMRRLEAKRKRRDAS
jgi:putative addiction module component (TIGR02574 family)